MWLTNKKGYNISVRLNKKGDKDEITTIRNSNRSGS